MCFVAPQDTICQCKQLWSLNVTFKADLAAGSAPDASSLLMDLSAALPNLAALQWRNGYYVQQAEHARHTFAAFIAKPSLGMEAAETLVGPGLRLLQAEQCSFASVAALPASLQVFLLQNMARRGRLHHPLNAKLDKLLAPCAPALRELYIVQVCTAASLDVPKLAACCPALRVLVLHTFMEKTRKRVSPLLHSSMH